MRVVIRKCVIVNAVEAVDTHFTITLHNHTFLYKQTESETELGYV